jgi:AraC-like DNA-binding protein
MTGSRAVPKTTRQSGLARWQVELALRLLLNDSASGHSLKQIAAHCGLSRSCFEKAFKVSFGTPPHQWPVRQSHLTRVFGALAGSSPAAWRRQRKASVASL